MKNQIKEHTNEERSIAKGILGAILGALVASIPWIIAYVYLEMILSVLAIIIAMGALKGYQIFKGKIDTKLPVLIAVVSVIVVIVATLIIIPMLYIIQDGGMLSIENLKIVYAHKGFSAAITKNLIVAIAFTALGISGVIANIKKQIARGDTVIKASLGKEENERIATNIEYVKEIFLSLNATSKDTAITKDKILKKMKTEENEEIFSELVARNKIKTYKNKYYMIIK